jgi:predicted nucleic acid-binding protein
VADSSVIAEALLKNKNVLEREDTIVTADLALYEVANSIWKNQFLLKTIEEGSGYLSLLLDLVESGTIVLIRPDLRLLGRAYEIAARERIPIYDAVFLALALELGVELRSLDGRTMKIFRSSHR